MLRSHELWLGSNNYTARPYTLIPYIIWKQLKNLQDMFDSMVNNDNKV